MQGCQVQLKLSADSCTKRNESAQLGDVLNALFNLTAVRRYDTKRTEKAEKLSISNLLLKIWCHNLSLLRFVFFSLFSPLSRLHTHTHTHKLTHTHTHTHTHSHTHTHTHFISFSLKHTPPLWHLHTRTQTHTLSLTIFTYHNLGGDIFSHHDRSCFLTITVLYAAVGLSGLNFTNVLRAAFIRADPKCAKKDSQVSSVIWRFWDLRA